jgi:hypothetical protein
MASSQICDRCMQQMITLCHDLKAGTYHWGCRRCGRQIVTVAPWAPRKETTCDYSSVAHGTGMTSR